MASSAVNQLVGMIASALQNEASLLLGVGDELDDLRAEFASMKSFLKDADAKLLISEGDYTWVANVRDLAYQSEDIIHEFLYNLHRQQRRGLLTRYLPKYLWRNRQICLKLQDVKKKIKAVHVRKLQYDINPREGSNDSNSTRLSQRYSSVFIKEEDVIGLKDESYHFEEWLIKDGEFRRTVISVVGMGGSGKTTLVTKIYNNDSIKRGFDCYGRVTVSQTYKKDDILRSLVKDIHQASKESVPDLTMMDFNDLVSMLIRYLDEKRFLVVLDDVWDTNVWDEMSSAFPENHLGSRIIVTTRREDVGSYCPGVKNHTLHMQPLNNNEAWELFSRKAFASYPSQCCPEELRKIARDLVVKCRGLPLAVVNMAGLMSSKKSVIEWTDVYNNLNWQLSSNARLEPVKHILLLSYIDLPYPLKHCLLYCSLFPEDHAIKRKRLIRLWIAEGFVQQDNRASPRQVAESYLMELIHRSMLQVVWRNDFGRPKQCKMHDLLRELALSISEKENFSVVLDGKTRITERCTNARRISVTSDKGDLESYEGMSQTRSLLVFAAVSTTAILSKKLKLVRILDLQNTLIDRLPDGLGDLYNLRYLNLRGTRVAELPKSIKKLYNLETLDMRDTLIKELPKGMEELQNLQHLIMYRYTKGSKWNTRGLDFQVVSGTRALFQINKLKKLEVMCNIEAEGGVIRQLGMMTQLTRMGITNLTPKDGTALCSSIQNLKKLSYLLLMASGEDEFLAVDALDSPPPNLGRVILAGKLERVPHCFCSLENLTHLCLHWSRMKEDPLHHIAELPNLRRLDLCHAYIGRELHFSKGFTKLRMLYMFYFPNVTVIHIEKEVMPDVQDMHLFNFTSLTAVPLGIEFLAKLQILVLPVSLENEYFKVQHVPNVYLLKPEE